MVNDERRSTAQDHDCRQGNDHDFLRSSSFLLFTARMLLFHGELFLSVFRIIHFILRENYYLIKNTVLERQPASQSFNVLRLVHRQYGLAVDHGKGEGALCRY